MLCHKLLVTHQPPIQENIIGGHLDFKSKQSQLDWNPIPLTDSEPKIASHPDPWPAFTSVYSRYLLKWKSEYPNIVENTEISRFLCHKLRILCVRKSEIWHAWVRFIPHTALVRAFQCDTKFLLNQFSTKKWCYIIPFSHRIMYDDVFQIC